MMGSGGQNFGRICDRALDGNVVHFDVNATMPGQNVHGLLFSGGISHAHKQQYVAFIDLVLQILGITLMNDGGNQRPDNSHSDDTTEGRKQGAAEHG